MFYSKILDVLIFWGGLDGHGGDFCWGNGGAPTSKERDCLGGGFKHFLCSPLFGEDFQFD